eukprot:scaffold7027_cov67-Phaeocystis_antarctica.AAC.1
MRAHEVAVELARDDSRAVAATEHAQKQPHVDRVDVDRHIIYELRHTHGSKLRGDVALVQHGLRHIDRRVAKQCVKVGGLPALLHEQPRVQPFVVADGFPAPLRARVAETKLDTPRIRDAYALEDELQHAILCALREGAHGGAVRRQAADPVGAITRVTAGLCGAWLLHLALDRCGERQIGETPHTTGPPRLPSERPRGRKFKYSYKLNSHWHGERVSDDRDDVELA